MPLSVVGLDIRWLATTDGNLTPATVDFKAGSGHKSVKWTGSSDPFRMPSDLKQMTDDLNFVNISHRKKSCMRRTRRPGCEGNDCQHHE
jgi:hypothetical protein